MSDQHTEHRELNDACIVSHSAIPPFDAEKYRNELHDLELSEQGLVELLRAIDLIMRSFVEIGWGVDSVMPALLQKTFTSATDEVEERNTSLEFSSAATDQAAESDGDDG